jgi:hypothetical protein
MCRKRITRGLIDERGQGVSAGEEMMRSEVKTPGCKSASLSESACPTESADASENLNEMDGEYHARADRG